MKIIFAGTPEAAVPSLRALLDSTHDVVAVLTRPDAPVGRKRVLTPSPVAQLAHDAGIPLLYANKIDDDIQKQITASGADLGVVVAYGALLPQATLDVPRLGWINLHFSELPHWRGAAPVQWQIISGETDAGSTVFSLVQELDAGDVFDSRTFAIDPDETSGELLARLSEHGSAQVLDVVDLLDRDVAVATPQSGESSYARKLSLEDGHLDTHAPVEVVYNLYRGVTPEPGAYVLLNSERLKIISMARSNISAPEGVIRFLEKSAILGCRDGALELITVQPSGKQAMSASDWFRGLRVKEVEVS
ncbi:methionyl-tRNA formyltransferase [Aurantimicrobium minutum]|uniref:methionyl-tRNA formyltransferase n=1 Tax=Aurantimicrobium minutum TaxID=708131 RepID=UPI0024747D97|nr:methionyl-tRNA formyltransferase [Aurantimicrobium minutum]MDH6532980.1 methionyl-tRNA formyltransferase [Aurantimicrobium minutum]